MYSCSNFNSQGISNILSSIVQLAGMTEFRQLIFKNENGVKVLQKIIKNSNVKFHSLDISSIIYSLGILSGSIDLGKQLTRLIRSTYNVLVSQIPPVSEFSIISSFRILSGFIKLMRNNIIIYNKPSQDLIRGLLINKVIANPSIINNKEMYKYIYPIVFFQEYLTKIELIKIFKNITFVTPNVDFLKSYFVSMGCLLVKIRKELDKDDKEKQDLLALESKVIIEIQGVWQQFKPKIKKFNYKTINAIYTY